MKIFILLFLASSLFGFASSPSKEELRIMYYEYQEICSIFKAGKLENNKLENWHICSIVPNETTKGSRLSFKGDVNILASNPNDLEIISPIQYEWSVTSLPQKGALSFHIYVMMRAMRDSGVLLCKYDLEKESFPGKMIESFWIPNVVAHEEAVLFLGNPKAGPLHDVFFPKEFKGVKDIEQFANAASSSSVFSSRILSCILKDKYNPSKQRPLVEEFVKTTQEPRHLLLVARALLSAKLYMTDLKPEYRKYVGRAGLILNVREAYNKLLEEEKANDKELDFILGTPMASAKQNTESE